MEQGRWQWRGHRRARRRAGHREPGRTGDHAPQSSDPAHTHHSARDAGAHRRQPRHHASTLQAAFYQ